MERTESKHNYFHYENFTLEKAMGEPRRVSVSFSWETETL